MGRNGGDRGRLGDVGLNQADGSLHHWVHGLGDAAQRVPLSGLGGPDGIVQDLIRDLQRQLVAVALRNQMEHEVQPRSAAGAGQDVAVVGEELLAHQGAGKLLGETGHARPMGRDLAGRDQTGTGQHVDAELHCGQGHALALLPPQPVDQLGTVVVLAAPATADKDDARGRVDVAQRASRQGHAVARDDLSARRRQVLPIVEGLRRQIVGNAHRLDGRRQRHHVETRDDHEGRPGMPSPGCLADHFCVVYGHADRLPRGILRRVGLVEKQKLVAINW